MAEGSISQNDGYQTPVVIHPMREDGYINAAKVNMLGKQNLVSLAFEQRDVVREDGTINHFAFPFREINQTHHIVGFFIYSKEYDIRNSFEEQWIRKRFVVSDEQSSSFVDVDKNWLQYNEYQTPCQYLFIK